MTDGRVPVLFDTDIGSDIDDAVALAYLLSQPRCELLGITTVTGEPVERARLADALCRAAGRGDVPVHAGVDTPFLIRQRQPEAPQKAVLGRRPHRKEFPENTAVPFMRDVIRSRPGEVTLLAVGPFTNVGALFAMDPGVPGLLKELVVMGGALTSRPAGTPRTEWNAAGDPHAAAVMFRAPVPLTRVFGLDVTLQCRLGADACRKRFRGGVLDVVAEMAEIWYGQRSEITFHDPLAAAALFSPEVCRESRGRVEVELGSQRVLGMTHWTPDPEGPHRAALEVDPELFFERYFSVFGG